MVDPALKSPRRSPLAITFCHKSATLAQKMPYWCMAHHPTGSTTATHSNPHKGAERRETAATKCLDRVDAWIDDEQWQAGLASKWGDGAGLWTPWTHLH